MDEHREEQDQFEDGDTGASRETRSRGYRGPRPSGKQSERLQVPSGYLLVIDQFMLSNDQFLNRLPSPPSGAPSGADTVSWVRAQDRELKSAAHAYGGCVVEVGSPAWEVFREPQQQLFVLAPANEESPPAEGEPGYDAELLAECRGNAAAVARVFVDTRCVVFVDAALLANRRVLDEYQQLRRSGNDKAARDLLRQQGGAVRYGFNREGDELGVFPLDGGRHFALWPDVIEEVAGHGQAEDFNADS